MAFNFPEFDFTDYNPKDPWHVPPQRILHFAFSAMEISSTSRRFWALQYRYPDLRFTVFHNLNGFAYALAGWAMLLRDKGHSIEWWQSQPEFNHVFTQPLVNSNVIGMRQLAELGYFQNLVREFDQDIRQIWNALESEEKPNSSGLALTKLWRHILKTADLQRFQPLLPLLLILRDSISYNGRFCPTDHEDLTLSYAGKTFRLIANEEIEFEAFGFIDHWDMTLYLLGELDQMLNLLFKTKALQAIPLIKMRYLEE